MVTERTISVDGCRGFSARGWGKKTRSSSEPTFEAAAVRGIIDRSSIGDGGGGCAEPILVVVLMVMELVMVVVVTVVAMGIW